MKSRDIRWHELMGFVQKAGPLTAAKLRRCDQTAVPFTIARSDYFFCKLRLFARMESDMRCVLHRTYASYEFFYRSLGI